MADKRVDIYLGASAMRTALGNSSETLSAMRRGEGGLRYSEEFGMYAGTAKVTLLEGFSRFESLLIEQIAEVVNQSGISLESDDVQLIISTTKGNIELLADCCDNLSERVFLYSSAERVAEYFHCKKSPIIISNACISGVSAFVIAREQLCNGRCKHAIVAGCDTLCEFITSGFASFKSISDAPCKPYDTQRNGLTLGEAAAAVLLTTEPTAEGGVRVAGGAISNDANHISGPSRTGDGLYYAIRNAMQEAGVSRENIGFVNTHGTATRYNDEMESKAVAWAELDKKPLVSLKGYIGHTLGAAGVVETILCAEQLKSGAIFGTKNFSSSDTPHALQISAESQVFKGCACVKTASGFGGCNAAIVLDMGEQKGNIHTSTRKVRVAAEYTLPTSEQPFAEYIRAEFKALGESNMKFYKMSDMCKALYVSVEHLLSTEGFEETEPERRAIILANSSASLDADIAHQRIVNRHLAEGASPATFVYTLANVAAGEMAIRHKMQGDNTFFVERENSGLAEQYARSLIENNRADAVICGWCDLLAESWKVEIKLLKTDNNH